MKATEFEYRNRTFLHLLVVGLALSTYLYDRVDIVWGLVRSHSNAALWEHWVFGSGAFMLVVSASLDTWVNARVPGPSGRVGDKHSPTQPQYPWHLARILLALSIGLLLPLSGTIVLIVGETILVLRLFLLDQERTYRPQLLFRNADGSWITAFRVAASKWGLATSMIVFACTLQDRIAEIGAALSFVLWLALNAPFRFRPRSS